MSDQLQFAIIAAIIIGISIVIWKGGAANPEGTGKLAREVGAMKGELTGLSTRIGYVEVEMGELKDESVSSKDIEALRGSFDDRIESLRVSFDDRINTLRAEMSGHRDLAQRTFLSVDRIERFLIERGLGGK